jgi:hypothetical protein
MLIIGLPLVSTANPTAHGDMGGDGCDGGEGGEGGGREHIRSSAPGTNSGDFLLLLVVTCYRRVISFSGARFARPRPPGVFGPRFGLSDTF